MQDFEDIRPYLDHEVRPVVDTLINDLEFTTAIAKYRYSRCHALFPSIVRKLVKRYLAKEMANIQTVDDVQAIIGKYLDNLIGKTTTSLTHDGLQYLDSSTPYLFISNHRDIAMDPALVNYILYQKSFKTFQIAIGDNLLKRPFLSNLMRLNKSFIVKRGISGREKLKESKRLSAYIHYSLEEGENVWLAQREGRSKNGLDRTESAIIKMLHLVKRDKSDKMGLAKTINSLHIVPVAISYGLDPCDEYKAEELFTVDTVGKFVKNEDSDVQSILAGMVGDKGDIHVAFGKPLELGNEVTAEEVAALIDAQIIKSYHLHPSNYFAFLEFKPDQKNTFDLAKIFNKSEAEIEQLKRNFHSRLGQMPIKLRPYLLAMYANPIISKSI